MLLDEILNGPLAATLAPLVLAQDYVSISAILNAQNVTINVPVAVEAFVLGAADTGIRATIQDKAADVSSPLRSSALSLLDLCQGSWDKVLDFSNPPNQTMMEAWVAAGAMTSEQEAQLLALATTNISRAQQIGIQATPLDVERVLTR